MATKVPLSVATICAVDQIPLGLGRSFQIGDKTVAIFRNRQGKIFAVENKCPHKGGPLSDGMMVGNQIVCPLHAFRFDGSSGECDQAHVCSIESYEVEESQGMVVLNLGE